MQAIMETIKVNEMLPLTLPLTLYFRQASSMEVFCRRFGVVVGILTILFWVNIIGNINMYTIGIYN